jgi:isoleucyl-tRNA synthetase
MYLICDGLARLLAPILPVTADDLWRYLPGTRAESVHLDTFQSVDGFGDSHLADTWAGLLAVRETVNAALEEKRNRGAADREDCVEGDLGSGGALAPDHGEHGHACPGVIILD